MDDDAISIDVLVIGGGVAGLWLLNELTRRGHRVLLAEARALGSAQTATCQGIIHGGLKYMFDGNLTPSARIISEMPALWRECLTGQRSPDLTGTTILSDCQYIWGTGSIKSRIFMTGSTIALRTKPIPIERSEWPDALRDVPGKVLRVGEQVIDPISMTRSLARPHEGRLLHIDPARVEFTRTGEQITSVRLHANAQARGSRPSLLLRPTTVILTAGEGNAGLRQKAGLSSAVAQLRPLHMTIVRGDLPNVFGHCVGGLKPRVTITSATDSAGQRVWLVGGQIAEDGVHMDPAELMRFARQELLTCIPGLNLSRAQFATYRIDRAEAATATGQKPDDVHVIRDGNLMTAWPTKLALAPRLAERIAAFLPPPASGDLPAVDFPAPPIASPPWEQAQWHTVP